MFRSHDPFELCDQFHSMMLGRVSNQFPYSPRRGTHAKPGIGRTTLASFAGSRQGVPKSKSPTTEPRSSTDSSQNAGRSPHGIRVHTHA